MTLLISVIGLKVDKKNTKEEIPDNKPKRRGQNATDLATPTRKEERVIKPKIYDFWQLKPNGVTLPVNRLRLKVFYRGYKGREGTSWQWCGRLTVILFLSSSPHPRLEILLTGYRLEVTVNIKWPVYSVKESGSLTPWRPKEILRVPSNTLEKFPI